MPVPRCRQRWKRILSIFTPNCLLCSLVCVSWFQLQTCVLNYCYSPNSVALFGWNAGSLKFIWLLFWCAIAWCLVHYHRHYRSYWLSLITILKETGCVSERWCLLRQHTSIFNEIVRRRRKLIYSGGIPMLFAVYTRTFISGRQRKRRSKEGRREKQILDFYEKAVDEKLTPCKL